LNTELSLTGKPATTLSICKNELIAFSLLNNKGLSTQTMIRICFKEHKKILEHLNQGEDLISIFCLNQNDSFFILLKALCSKVSFYKAMECLEKLEKSNGKLKKEIGKQIAYPAFIFLFALAMIWFFAGSILPSMAVYSQGGSSFFIIHLLQAMYTLLFMLALLLGGCYLIFQYSPNPPAFLKRMILSLPVIKKIYTVQFALILKTLLEAGLSTNELLDVLKSMKNIKCVAIFYERIESELCKGTPFIEVLSHMPGSDPSFSFYIQSGIESLQLPSLLELYSEQSMFYLQEWAKKVSLYVQLASYSCVGILVLVVYQIMLMPLNMLYTI
jgi:type II secretory pathway component PulF